MMDAHVTDAMIAAFALFAATVLVSRSNGTRKEEG